MPRKMPDASSAIKIAKSWPPKPHNRPPRVYFILSKREGELVESGNVYSSINDDDINSCASDYAKGREYNSIAGQQNQVSNIKNYSDTDYGYERYDKNALKNGHEKNSLNSFKTSGIDYRKASVDKKKKCGYEKMDTAFPLALNSINGLGTPNDKTSDNRKPNANQRLTTCIKNETADEYEVPGIEKKVEHLNMENNVKENKTSHTYEKPDLLIEDNMSLGDIVTFFFDEATDSKDKTSNILIHHSAEIHNNKDSCAFEGDPQSDLSCSVVDLTDKTDSIKRLEKDSHELERINTCVDSPDSVRTEKQEIVHRVDNANPNFSKIVSVDIQDTAETVKEVIETDDTVVRKTNG